jgi:ubiquinone/menaquinone biosynthesis C-methylase UbiE
MDYNKDTRDAYRNELKAKEYQEQYTKGTKWARFTMWRQRVLIDKIINQCNFKKTDKILDIPCGTGFIGKTLSKTPASIIASDISREMMERAYGEYVGDNFNGFVECDITKTPFRKESFDCIILLAFMHRLPKEIRAKTTEIKAVVDKKGAS